MKHKGSRSSANKISSTPNSELESFTAVDLAKCWKVMVVDDDQAVHHKTKKAFHDFEFESRPIEILSAYSEREMKTLLDEHQDTAVILVDLEMEKQDSGLTAVKYIRHTLKNAIVRIILQTERQNEAPAESIIIQYDINGYKVKPEATSLDMLTSIVTALRSFRDLTALAHSEKNLIRINQQLDREIKERKETETALLQSEAKTRSILNAIPDLIFIISREGVFLEYSQSKNISLYQPPETFLGRHISDALPKWLSQLTLKHLNRINATGKTQIYEYQLPSDEEKRYFEARMMSSQEGHIICLIRDVTENKKSENALKESESRYRRLFNSGNDAIFVHRFSETGPPNALIDVNDVACKRYGFAREEFLQMKAVDLHADPVTADHIQLFRDGILSDKQVSYESMHVTKDGQRFPVEMRAYFVELDGKPTIFSMARDISKRKKAQKALQVSEARYRHLFNRANDAIFVYGFLEDGLPGNFYDVNDVACERYGYSREEFCSIGPKQLDSELRLSELSPNIQKLKSEKYIVYEMTHVTRHGREIPVEISSTVIELDGEIAVVSIARDITERKQIEEGLRKHRDQLEELVEDRTERLKRMTSIAERLIGILDLDRLLLDIVNSVKEQLNYYYVHIYLLDEESNNLLMAAGTGRIGEMLRDQGHKIPVDTAVSFVARAARTGQVIFVNDVQKSMHWLPNPLLPNTRSEIAVPIVLEKNLVGVLDVQSDQVAGLDESDASLFTTLANYIAVTISNARLFEQTVMAKESAESANRAKSTFLAQMSHELRTPLNAILGYAQILQQQELPSKTMSGLNTIQKSGDHLLTLINDILDIAKIEAGRMELNPKWIHFPTFLNGIAGIVRSRAEAKNLTFKLDMPDLIPNGIEVDETRLRQILLNLLGNAVKFTSQGEVVFRLSKAKCPNLDSDSSHCIFHFEIEDTGVGIDLEHQDRIFKPFEQVSNRNYSYGGSGLGLAITRQLVHLMDGEIGFNSRQNQGSTFWFEIVLPARKTTSTEAETKNETIIGYHGSRRHVLVVDDIPSNRAVLNELLQILGFDVQEAENGAEAVASVKNVVPDIILMDRWMPIMDGIQAVIQLRQMASVKNTPIVAVSASVAKEDREMIEASGFDDFLIKPVEWSALIDILSEHLNIDWKIESNELSTIYDDRSDEGELVFPPAEEMMTLKNLIQLGRMSRVLEWAKHVETLDDAYTPFAQKVYYLAESYEINELANLVKKVEK